jgi:hypothetical protein
MPKKPSFAVLLIVSIGGVALLLPLVFHLGSSLGQARTTPEAAERLHEVTAGGSVQRVEQGKLPVPRFRPHEVSQPFTKRKVSVKPAMSESEWLEELSPREPWAGPQPKTVTEILADTRINRGRLEQLRARDPDLQFLDYKLRVLSATRECVGDVPNVAGGMSVALQFAIDPQTLVATGTEVVPEHSLLPPEVDARLLQCLQQAHVGNQFQRHKNTTTNTLVWAATIYLPISSYPTYRWLYAQPVN